MPEPKFEKEALVSVMVEAATVMASLTRAGELLTASSLSFPAATTTGTPELKSWMRGKGLGRASGSMQVVGLTRTIALSRAFETPPPRLMEATVGVLVR